MVLEDLTLVGAIVMALFGMIGLVTAWVEDQFPMRGLAFLVLAGVLGYETWQARGGVLILEDVPIAFMRLINIALQQLT